MKKFQVSSLPTPPKLPFRLRRPGKFQVILLAAFLFVASGAEAQYGFTNYLGNSPGQQFNVQQLFNLLNRLTCYFIQFAVIIFGGMLVIYGLMFFKSRGSPQGMAEARKALTWGLVGGLIIFSVFTIILSVASFIGVDFPVINKIQCL